MGKYIQSARAIDDNCALVAESVRLDFCDLVLIFENHLSRVPHTDIEARSEMEKARATAERGLKLSQVLVDLLRSQE
jgi:hypothetical protein